MYIHIYIYTHYMGKSENMDDLGVPPMTKRPPKSENPLATGSVRPRAELREWAGHGPGFRWTGQSNMFQ